VNTLVLTPAWLGRMLQSPIAALDVRAEPPASGVRAR